MNWHYLEGNEQRGPVTDADLEALARSGKVGNDTLVWREGMAEWQTHLKAIGPVAGKAPPDFGAGTLAAGQVACAECGRGFALDQVIRHGNVYICESCKPVFLQKLKEGISTQGGLVYGGFWVRFAARFLDGLLLEAVLVPLNLVLASSISSGPRSLATFSLNYAIAITVGVCYETLLIGKYGATLGKMACKLRVVNADGSKVSYGKAFGRYFAANWISGLFTLCIGYIMAGFDDEKRALHDRICGTRVVLKK